MCQSTNFWAAPPLCARSALDRFTAAECLAGSPNGKIWLTLLWRGSVNDRWCVPEWHGASRKGVWLRLDWPCRGAYR
jgi:hypothetical protein